MPLPKCTDDEFIALWNKHKSATVLAKELGVSERNVHQRRRNIEKRHALLLKSKGTNSPDVYLRDHLSRANVSLQNGIIMVASDAHYWPDEPSTAHKAFVKIARKLKPDVVVMNGDVFDGATNSRHLRSHWDTVKKPTVKEELEVVSDRLNEIHNVTLNARHFWTLGNHDMRYEAKLANLVPEYEGIAGFSLKDHFPSWIHAMSVMVNDDLMIKHRTNKSGVHATWNNVIHSGSIHIVTGHLHRLQATIFSNYRGHFWGIDSGTLAEVDGDHMGYGEDNPKNHASGFVVLTLHDGFLLHPEFCHVQDGIAFFRGKPV